MHDLFKAITDDFASLPAKVVAAQVKASPRKRGDGKSLSIREQQVAQGIARGDSPAMIARDLCLSVKTIGTHRAHVMEKLGLESNAQIAVYFERQLQADLRQALANLVAYVEHQRANSEGRWEPDMTCSVCTQGVSPTKELCAWHAAKRLVK